MTTNETFIKTMRTKPRNAPVQPFKQKPWARGTDKRKNALEELS